jgi:hypothetical protein
MKKAKYLLLLVLFAIITTGCVKFNANMDIKKDKSMEFSVIYAFDKSLMGEDNSLKEEDMSEPKKCGFEVTKYSEGNYEGFKLTKKIANIDEVSAETDVTYDLSGMMDEGVCNGKMFKVVKGSDKNTYTAKFKFDANSGTSTNDTETVENGVETTETPGDAEATPDEDYALTGDEENFDLTSEGSNMDLSGLMSNMDLSFSVNLPYKAISNNATTQENDNKKLTWKLGYSGEQTIEFAFELKNNDSSNMMLYIAVGAAILVFIILLILVISKMRKKNKAVPEVINNDEVVEPVADTTVETNEPVVETTEESVVPGDNSEGSTDNKEL